MGGRMWGSEGEMAAVGKCVCTCALQLVSVWEIMELQGVEPSWKKQALKG